MRSVVSSGTREESPPISCHLRQRPPHIHKASGVCQYSIIETQQDLCFSADFRRAPTCEAALEKVSFGPPRCLTHPRTSIRPPLCPRPNFWPKHACVRTEARGRRKLPGMGRSGGVKGGQIWTPNLCRKNPAGAAEGLFRMAPLRPPDLPVTDHLVLPPGPLAVPPHHVSSRATGPAFDPPRSGP